MPFHGETLLLDVDILEVSNWCVENFEWARLFPSSLAWFADSIHILLTNLFTDMFVIHYTFLTNLTLRQWAL